MSWNGGGGGRGLTSRRRRLPARAGRLLAVALLAAAAVAAAAAAAGPPGDAYARGAHHPECQSGSDADCVYHVTRAFHVGDIEPTVIKEDPVTGHVYVSNTPHAASADYNYSHLRIYDSYENGHALIKDIRFNGTNSRIADFAINNATRELHVAHMWGIGDASAGWNGEVWNVDGRANLTTIDIGTYEVIGTAALVHGEIPQGGTNPVNETRYHLSEVVIDEGRDAAYVSSYRNMPALVVDTSDTTLLYAVSNRTVGIDPSEGYDAYERGVPIRAMAVDEETGKVYASVRVGDRFDYYPLYVGEGKGDYSFVDGDFTFVGAGQGNQSSIGYHSWGIATLSFEDGDGELTQYYTREHFLNLTTNPAPAAPAGCNLRSYSTHPCDDDVNVADMYLDSDPKQLFVLYENDTVWAFKINEDGHPEEPVHVDVGPGGDRIHDMVLDDERGLLYVVRYDYTNPRVIVNNATDRDNNYTAIGSASLTSQPVGIGLDPIGGTVYALPQWSPHAYVIEAEPRSGLQKRIDDATAGDTIVVADGTYDDTVLDVTKPLTLTSASGEPGGVVFTGYSRIEVEADDTTIRGLAFEDTDCLPGYGGSLIEIRTNPGSRADLVIENNTFRNTCHPAIQKEGIGEIVNIAIRNNVFENIGLRLPDGETEPLDTGGENAYQIAHGAIGLAHHVGQGTVGGVIADNHISGTSAAGIRVFKADGLAITGNYIANTPASAIGLAHVTKNVLVANNTIVGANNEPDLDYLAGINGSGEQGYYKFLNLQGAANYAYLGFAPYHNSESTQSGADFTNFGFANLPWLNGTAIPSPDAAINVWSRADNENITITGNVISGSDGAFTVCTGVCGFESDGLVKPRHRNIAPVTNTGNIGGEIDFSGNTIRAYEGPDNGGVQVRSHMLGAVDASDNKFVGCGMAGEPVRTAGNVNNGSATYEDGACVYHVTRTMAVGDIIPSVVAVHNGTGHVYVANRPHLGTADQNYSHLYIYDSQENGHALIKDVRFNGTNSRIADIEVDHAEDGLYVAHMWGVGDASEGWDGRQANNDGRANLTRLDAGAGYVVDGTIELLHGERPQGGGPVVNVTRNVVMDLALDTARDRAYVSMGRQGPVLAVDTSPADGAMELAYTSFANTAGDTSASAGEWDAYDVGGPASALAVDEDTGLVYAAVRAGDKSSLMNHTWGIATLSFDDGGALAPNYTRMDYLQTASNANAGCGAGGYNLYPCNGAVLVDSLHLSGDKKKLFALYKNHTVWAFELDASGYPRSPAEVDVRASDPPPGVYGEAGHPQDVHNQIGGIVLDGARGLLYASLYDFANPRVVVVDAGTHERAGVASVSSQVWGLGLHGRTGAVYALPQWTPNAYVIEAAPLPALQEMADRAMPGSRITLLPGTYNDTVLDITKPLSVESVGGQAGPVVFTGHSRIEVEADGVAIRGLSFEDTACLPGFAGSLIELRTYHDRTRSNVTIEANAFRDTCHAAVQQEGTGGIAGIAVRGNVFENIGLKTAGGRAQPLDTGGENEFQLFHGAIGLAFHPSQKPVSGNISGNLINGTSAAGIRVFNADGMTISGNTIMDTPASAIGLAHGPSNVAVSDNTISNANSEPNLDYLDGVEGSSDPGYYRFINLARPNPLEHLGMYVLTDEAARPSPDAAISVWADAANVSVTGNTIRGSDGAFTVCTGVCAFESDGPVRKTARNMPDNTAPITGEVRFTGNTVHAYEGPDNNGRLVVSRALGTLDATGNTFVGINASAAAAGTVRTDSGRAALAASADAAFSGPNAIRIEYAAALGPPAGHEGPVYGSVTGPGGLDEAPTSVSGLHTTVHTIEFGGDGVAAGQNGTIALLVGLEGAGPGGALYSHAAGAIPVKPRLATVYGVTVPNATGEPYLAGSEVAIAVEFGRAVFVVGEQGGGAAPTLELDVGGDGRNATYAGGSGTRSLLFEYAVQPGDRADPLDYTGSGALAANGATVRDTAGADADLALPDPPGPLAAAGVEVGQEPNTALESAAFASPGTARFVYGAALSASASDYTDLRVGPSNATASVTGVNGSGTRAHTVSFDTEYGVTASTRGLVDVAPLASLPPLPPGSLFGGADDRAVGSGADAGMVAVAPPGSPPVAIEPDSFVGTVRGNGTAAIVAPTGTLPPAANVTVETDRATVTFAPGTNITGRGTGEPYTAAISVAVVADAPGADRRDAALEGLGRLGVGNASARIGHVVEIGSPTADIDLDAAARIVLVGQPSPARVYHMGSAGAVTQILVCGDASDPAGWLAGSGAGGAAGQFCYTVPAGNATTKDYTIYTYRLSAFFVVGEAAAAERPPAANMTRPTNTTTGMLMATIVPAQAGRQPAPDVVPVAPGQFFGGGGGGGRGGGGSGGGIGAPAGAGAVVIYGAAWDCNEGVIQVTLNRGVGPMVTVLSSEGVVAAQRADGPHPEGRVIYEAPLPGDPVMSIRAVLADGRAVSTASESLRTEGECTGEAVFRQYGAPAGAMQPPADTSDGAAADGQQAQQPPQPPPAGPGAADGMQPPADTSDGAAADGQQPPRPQPIEIPPPPPEPPADPSDGAAADGQREQPPGDAAAPGADGAAAADDEGGCLIATAAHGTELAPQVQRLREVRDGTLLTTESGRAFMSAFSAAYYAFSPQVADLERAHPAFRQAVAALAAPMLYALSVVEAAEPGSEHEVVAYGALAMSLVAGMYVAAPAAGAWYAARLGRRLRRGIGGGRAAPASS